MQEILSSIFNFRALFFQINDIDGLDRTAGAIRGRSGRICNVVSAEMDNYEPGYYTGRVMEAVKLLSERVMPNFAEKVENYVQKLSNGLELTQMDQNEFIDAARLVYEGVREIRRAVLLNRGTIEYDSDVENEWDNPDIDYSKAENNPFGAISGSEVKIVILGTLQVFDISRVYC